MVILDRPTASVGERASCMSTGSYGGDLWYHAGSRRNVNDFSGCRCPPVPTHCPLR